MVRLLEVLLLVTGSALLALWSTATLHQHLVSAWDRAAFGASLRAAAPQGETLGGVPPDAWSEPGVDTTLWSAGRITAYLETLGTPSAHSQRLALLEIPAIDLSVVVLEGTDEWILNRGVGRIPGTVRPGRSGNSGIAGHRDGFFRGLQHVKPEDIIKITTPGAREPRHYRIEWIRVVKPEDVWVLDPTEGPSLTLVTCHPFYFVGHAPERYIVRAVALVESATARSPEPPER
jgi:sortase A